MRLPLTALALLIASQASLAHALPSLDPDGKLPMVGQFTEINDAVYLNLDKVKVVEAYFVAPGVQIFPLSEDGIRKGMEAFKATQAAIDTSFTKAPEPQAPRSRPQRQGDAQLKVSAVIRFDDYNASVFGSDQYYATAKTEPIEKGLRQSLAHLNAVLRAMPSLVKIGSLTQKNGELYVNLSQVKIFDATVHVNSGRTFSFIPLTAARLKQVIDTVKDDMANAKAHPKSNATVPEPINVKVTFRFDELQAPAFEYQEERTLADIPTIEAGLNQSIANFSQLLKLVQQTAP